MFSGLYELVIVWENGDKDIYEYKTREDAEKGADNMKMANGEQIAWAGVRKQTVK